MIALEGSETTWEEVETVIGKESNMTLNGLALMASAGALATVGLETNALHYVIAGMPIAPGFKPLTRIGLGIVARNLSWRRGLFHTLMGYVALILGAAVTSLVLRAFGTTPSDTQASYLSSGALLDYWMNPTAPSLLMSAIGSIGGAILIATGRSVLTSGVMIALALVPGAALVGMGVASGNAGLIGSGALRWLIDAVMVVAFAIAVFMWKRVNVHRSASLL